MSQVKQQIAQLDNIYATPTSPDIFKEWLSLKAGLGLNPAAEIQIHYAHGDEASRPLAHYLRQTVSSHQVPQIRTSSQIPS